MDERDDLQATLRATFADELRERAAALARELRALEDADDPAALVAVSERFHRLAYNLRGAALAVALPDVAHLAGALNGALAGLLLPDAPPTTAWSAALGRAIAFLPALAEAGYAGTQPPELFTILADLVAPEAPPATPPVEPVAPSPARQPAPRADAPPPSAPAPATGARRSRCASR